MSKEYIDSLKGYDQHIGFTKTKKVSKEYEIGINRVADASTDLTIFERLKPILNVIITRDLSSDIFFNNLLKYKTNIILHVVVTGYGATPMEPYTPHPRYIYNRLIQLINNGFPKEQFVLRIDPIIPNKEGLEMFRTVLEAFSKLHIKRCRYKIFLCNENIYTRPNWMYLNMQGFKNPYYNEIENKIYKSASKYHRQNINAIIKEYEHIYEFESCDRDDYNSTSHQLGCISFKDLRVLGVNEVDLQPQYDTKNNCRCPVNTVELIKKSSQQCRLKCLHCKKQTSVI